MLIPRLTVDNFPWVVFQSCERLYAFCSLQYYSQCHLSKHIALFILSDNRPQPDCIVAQHSRRIFNVQGCNFCIVDLLATTIPVFVNLHTLLRLQ